MRKTLLVIVTASLLLTACSGNDPRSELASFREFIEARNSGSTLTLPSGMTLQCFELQLERESAEYAREVTLDWWLLDDYEYILESEHFSRDLRYLGDLVVAYADSCGWSNSYYLYVEVSRPTQWSVTYDYEEEKLYWPKRFSLLQTIVRKFGTLDDDEICSSEEGRAFLLSHDLAEIRHGKLELDLTAWNSSFSSSKVVWITSEGEFKSYNPG